MSLHNLILFGLAASALLNLFSIGLNTGPQDATYLFRRPVELLRALLAMNVLMPLFALGLNTIFDFTPAVKIALVALSVSPIPPPIPAKGLKSGGKGSYVIGLQIAIGVLAIVVVPLAMAAIGNLRHGALQSSIGPVAKVVFVSIVIPIVAGIFVRQLAPAFADRVAQPLTSISGLGVVAGIVVVWISAAPAMWSLIGNGTVIAFAAFVIVGLAIGHGLGGPVPANRTSLAIATSSRHPGVALLLARANFPAETLVVAAVLLYLLVNAVLVIPYLLWIKRRQSQFDNLGNPVVAEELQRAQLTNEARK
jgi:bile acid:Na+ symporter, BASS family